MSRAAARILANAIRHGARRHDQTEGRRVYRGRVTALNPLGVDLLGTDLSLDDGDVTFSQDVRRYSASEGLKIGDVLALLEVEHGDYLAVTVLSDATVRVVPA